MPFYEYECASCKFYTEQLQKVSDPPLRKCPSCGRSTMKKLVSAPNFRLKGGGWYETDFKSDQEKKRNLVEKEPEAKSEETKPKAEEAKPADAKADAKPSETKPAEKASGGESRSSSASRSKKKAPAKSKPRTKAAPKRRARR
ncbi:MAG TPA: zinc ribbon domain-containing protein [Thermoanaerobaculia bacterium]|nr:zinc ribbon domain-containing protein [Thermoanaerobaculia bacterium]